MDFPDDAAASSGPTAVRSVQSNRAGQRATPQGGEAERSQFLGWEHKGRRVSNEEIRGRGGGFFSLLGRQGSIALILLESIVEFPNADADLGRRGFAIPAMALERIENQLPFHHLNRGDGMWWCEITRCE